MARVGVRARVRAWVRAGVRAWVGVASICYFAIHLKLVPLERSSFISMYDVLYLLGSESSG